MRDGVRGWDRDRGAEYGRIGAVCGRIGGLSADSVTARE